MGWFSSSTPSKPPSTDHDPLRDLDPDLRAFLDKESPVKYKPSASPPPSSSPTATTTSSSTQTSQLPSPSPSTTTTTTAPPQSLYPDGRYASLWSTYTPLSEIENANKSDQERLLDVLEGYKQRKADIGRAALENCALEQWAVQDCWKGGGRGWKGRMTMCRAENKEFERCFLMQSRFLKALGYLSSYERPAHLDEEIQMHADTLYHRMLDQEKAIEAAKAAGEPIPSFLPILSPSRTPTTPASSPSHSSSTTPPSSTSPTTIPEYDAMRQAPKEEKVKLKLTKEARDELKKRTKDQPQIVKELEERAMYSEAESDIGVQRRINELTKARDQARKERRERGEATVGDTVSGWFGW